MLSRFSQTTYPLGYIGERYENHADGDPCLGVMKAFNRQGNMIDSLELKQHRLDVLELAYDKFEPFGGWVGFYNQNLKEAKLSPLAVRFLHDTNKFITTGVRDIHILSWEALLANDTGKRMVNTDKADRPNLSSGECDISLSQWIYRTDGFQDMVWSLKILFGELDKVSTYR